MVAFDFLPAKGESNIYLYQLGSNEFAKKIIQGKDSGTSFMPEHQKISSRLAHWSFEDNNSLYLLYSLKKEQRLVGKIENLNYNALPLDISLVQKLYNTIKQQSGVSEYYPVTYLGTEYLFIKEKDLPGVIQYTDQYSRLEELPGLAKQLQTNETISSFSISNDVSRIIICKGEDKDKQLVLGDFDMDRNGINSINYDIVLVPKSADGVLQEPSFNPVNPDVIVYLEMVRNSRKENIYKLVLHRLDTSENYLLTDKLYRNENNKTARPNSTSYMWHPSGEYIFFINTDAERKIIIINLGQLSSAFVQVLPTEIEYAEQISLSPNGQYLAVMMKITEDINNSDDLGQLYIVELEL